MGPDGRQSLEVTLNNVEVRRFRVNLKSIGAKWQSDEPERKLNSLEWKSDTFLFFGPGGKSLYDASRPPWSGRQYQNSTD